MKEMLEGHEVTARTQKHLDRCLTCRACETTCPSGVRYGRLVDIGRNIVEQHVPRSLVETLKRAALRTVLPRPALFTPLLRVGQAVRPLLPGPIRRKIPQSRAGNLAWPATPRERRMLVLDGCVQPVLAPDINPAAARVLDKLGITLVRAQAAGCCGAVTFHLNRQTDALDYMRRNIDAWWPDVEAGAEAVVITASGCGTMVKEYGHHLAHDPRYAQKAARISALAKDIGEIVFAEKEELDRLLSVRATGSQQPSQVAVKPRIAFHSPCSLQHGQQLRGQVEAILLAAGFELTMVPDSHLCCGSAGTYSILEPQLSQRLLKNKVAALESDAPSVVATANIGCLTHIQSGATVKVKHWINVLDERLS
jgi:glycolate oxidase iron-sulfur subunit